MVTLSEIDKKYVGDSPPTGFVFWENVHFTGDKHLVKAEGSTIMDYSKYMGKVGFWPKSMWVPPHCKVTLFNEDKSEKHTFLPGLHADLKGTADFTYRLMQMQTTLIWSAHQKHCCTHEDDATSTNCGTYWDRKGAGCVELLGPPGDGDTPEDVIAALTAKLAADDLAATTKKNTQMLMMFVLLVMLAVYVSQSGGGGGGYGSSRGMGYGRPSVGYMM